jgi:hypothetical protein
VQREYRCTPEVDKAIDRPNQNRSERVAPIGTPGLSVDHVRTDGTHHAPTTASSEIASRTRDEQTFQGERQLRRSLIRSFFRLNREAKGYVCRPVDNFQDVIAKSTTELARSPLLRKQLNAAIASVTFGTSGVGFLHFSFHFCRSFPAANHQTDKRLCARVWSFVFRRSIKIFFKKFVEPQNQNHFDLVAASRFRVVRARFTALLRWR